MSVEAAKDARGLLLKEHRAVLSAHSKKWSGFPFGSAIPCYLDVGGRPLILISRIAQHTHNLQVDPRCSMLVGERGAEDIQAVGRLTLLAEARQLTEREVAATVERYYHCFPESANYHRVHDFDFWVLQPVQWRFIGSFGTIYWSATGRVPLTNPFAGEAEHGMVRHMNKDHTAATAHCVELARLPTYTTAQLAGIDTGGFHLRIGQGLHWLSFPTACGNPEAVRQALVQLARAKRWPTVEPEQG